jgi:hypothetical protein
MHLYEIETPEGHKYQVQAYNDDQANRIADVIRKQSAAGNPDLNGVEFPDQAVLIPHSFTPPEDQPKPQPDNGKGFLDTGMGWAVRHGAQAASALPGLLFDATANDPGGTRRAVDELLNNIGARKDETRLDRVLGAGFEGLAGMLTTGPIAAGERAAPGLLKAAFLPGAEATGAIAGNVAGQEVRENGGDAKEQILASLLAGLAPSALRTGAAATVRGVMRGADATPIADAIDQFRAAGTTPTVGEALEGNPSSIEAFLSQFFPSSKNILRRYQKQEQEIGQNLEQRANSLYPPLSNSDTGAMISSEAEEGFKPNGRGIVDQKFDNLNKLLPLDTRIDMGPFQEYVAGKSSINPMAKNTLSNPLIGGGDQADWASLGSALKTDLANNLKNTGQGGLPLDAVK